jgi:hypothetical protein
MKIVNFISNFFINHHLLKLDINNDLIEFILICSILYTCFLFLCGILITKFSILHTLLHLIYCVLNSIIILFFCGLLIFLLGNAGIITFCLLFVIFLITGFAYFIVNNNMYVFNVGKLSEWICDNYKNKRVFFTKLNNDYKNFKQYNQEII